jgi:protein transport protein SEC61 subunit gamma-like protein
MGVSEGLKRYVRVLKLSKKPSWDEFWLYTKLTLLGISILGIISFIIQLVASFFILGGG